MEAKETDTENVSRPESDCYNEEYQTFAIDQVYGVRNEDTWNFQAISESQFVFFSGIHVAICDLKTNVKRNIYSRDNGGIGSIALHVNKQLLAVAEKGNKPNIYIYRVDDFLLMNVLVGGTEREFSSVCFSKNSDKLVSVGSGPDYSIVLWNWRTSQILLRTKAFSQEVYRVSFSDFSDDLICSAGMAHIKFWQVASTFTGLKLKGEVGKFGLSELSDIVDFVHLNNKNVLSGSEWGYLLLWEGNFIKNRITRRNKEPCHAGSVVCVRQFKELLLITASNRDNVIRVWSATDFSNLDTEGVFDVEMSPLNEVLLEETFGVLNIDVTLLNSGSLYIHEKHGQLIKVQLGNENEPVTVESVSQYKPIMKVIHQFNCNEISCATNIESTIVLGGSDGQVKKLNLKTNSIECFKVDENEITCIATNETGNVVILGNSKGLVKSYTFQLEEVASMYKIFEESVDFMQFGEHNLVCASVKNIFVLKVKAKGVMIPVCLVEANSLRITASILLKEMFVYGNSIGEVKGFFIPEIAEHIDRDNYFLNNMEFEFYGRLRMMDFQKPKKDENDIRYYLNDELKFVDVEWEPRAIRSMTIFYEDKLLKNSLNQIKVLVSSEQEFCGYLYALNVEITKIEKNNEQSQSSAIVRPSNAFQTRKKIVTLLRYELEHGTCLLGYIDGVVSIRRKNDLNEEIGKVRCHSQDIGSVIAACMLDSYLMMSVATDSTLVIMHTSPVSKSKAVNRIESKLLKCVSVKREIKDIERALIGAYSLQRDKVQSSKDQIERSMKRKQDEILKSVAQLRISYNELKADNQKQSCSLRIAQSELDFDRAQRNQLTKCLKEQVDELRREVEFDVKVAKMKVDKLKRVLIDENVEPLFKVSQISSEMSVESFRVKNMSNYMLASLEKIRTIIENEDKEAKSEGIEVEEKQSLSDSRGLLGMLNDLKRRINETKSKDPYQQYKHKIKEECAEFNTIEKLREFEKSISGEIESARRCENDWKLSSESDEVQVARDSIGDYVLKTSPNYRLNENMPIDTKNLQTHILLLEKFLFSSKTSFNKSLSELRSRKQLIVESIRDANKQIERINAKLNIAEPPFKYVCVAIDEFPQLKIRVTEKEIADHIQESQEYRTSRREDKVETEFDAEFTKQKQRALDQFTNTELILKHQSEALEQMGYREERVTPEVKEQRQKTNDDFAEFKRECEARQEMSVTQTTRSIMSDLKRVINEPRPKRKSNANNDRSAKIERVNSARLKSTKAQIAERLKRDIEEFDADIVKMCVEKSNAENDLKMAEMRVLEIFRELLEIQIFEEEDEILRADLLRLKEGSKELYEKKVANANLMKKTQTKIASLEVDLSTLQETYNEKVYFSEPQKAEFVYTYFCANFRQSSKLDKNEDGEDNGVKEFDLNSMDPEKREWVLFFEQNEDWLEVLKKRYETDEALQETHKSRSELSVEEKKIEEKIQLLKKATMDVKNNLDELQVKKMQRIQRLNCSFILELDQVFVDCPITDLSSCVVFTNKKLDTIKGRLEMLENDCRKIESERNELCVSQDAMHRSLNILKVCKKEANSELEENFKLKFGEQVDLNILNALKETKRVKDLKREYQEIERISEKKTKDAKNAFFGTQKELTDLKRKNTEILNRITELSKAQIRLNKTLDNTNKQIFKDEKEVQAEDAQNNKKEIVKVIEFLNSELDSLRHEINVLKRK